MQCLVGLVSPSGCAGGRPQGVAVLVWRRSMRFASPRSVRRPQGVTKSVACACFGRLSRHFCGMCVCVLEPCAMHSSPRRCFSPCTMPQSSSLERFCLASSRLRPMATAQSEEAGGGSASASDALAPTSVVPVGNSSLHPHRDVLFCDSVGPERMVLTHVLTLERFDLPPRHLGDSV